MHQGTFVLCGQGIVVHLDGARVFNAATALGVDVKEIASKVTSIQLCLSKVRSDFLGFQLFVKTERKYACFLYFKGPSPCVCTHAWPADCFCCPLMFGENGQRQWTERLLAFQYRDRIKGFIMRDALDHRSSPNRAPPGTSGGLGFVVYLESF